MNPKNIKRSVEIARALQYKQNGRCFHCTVVWRKNRLVSIGLNDYTRSHPICLKFGYQKFKGASYLPGIHSELNAYLKLGQEYCFDYSFVNIRLGFKGEFRNSKPCSGCSGLLRQVGFNKFYYSTENGFVDLTNPQSTAIL